VEYDEETELTRYVWDHFSSLMTDFERRVGSAIVGRMKAAASGNTPIGRMLNERWGHTGDPQVNSALADGAEAFRRRVCRRVLAERVDEVFITRCRQCGCVARTPRARQCFWCGFDWHSPPPIESKSDDC
jgi:hypothetical protein